MITRLHDFRSRDVVDQIEFRLENAGPFIRFDWVGRCGKVVIFDAHDDLEPLGADRVVRRTYSYHATVEDGPNIVRFDGPDEDEVPPYVDDYSFFEVTHHGHHHIHRYNPLGSQEEEIDVVDREDTPTLPEFVEEVIAWYHENEDVIDRVSD
jgi:hypothetical protein